MAEKKLVLVLNASSEYIRHSGDDVKKYSSVMNKFFESINETYLPLLEMFERLEDPFRSGLGLYFRLWYARFLKILKFRGSIWNGSTKGLNLGNGNWRIPNILLR